jgi:hypothetical protein
MPAARRKTAPRRTAKKPAPKPVDPLPALPAGERLWILDVPYAERGVASANGARWHTGLRATIYTGRALPHGLTPYASRPFSWERWREDDLNDTPGPVPSAEHTLQPRPHQREAAAAILRAARAGARGFLLADDVGLGKAQPLDSLVLTPIGFARMSDMRVGSQVMNPDGGVARVVGVYPQGVRDVYQVTFADGTQVRCDADHLWAVNTTIRNSRRNPDLVKTTRDIAADLHMKNGSPKWYCRAMSSVPEIDNGGDRPLDPYLLGVLLGDGHFKYAATAVSTADAEILDSVNMLVPEGVWVKPSTTRPYDYFITREAPSGPNPVRVALKQLGLLGHGSETKFIPLAYKEAPTDVRVAVLQGLMDTDGSIERKSSHLELSSVSKTLANDVAWLARSLGGFARVRERAVWFTRDGERHEGRNSFRVSISSLPPGVLPFRLSRKASHYRTPVRYMNGRAIRSVEAVGREPTQCIRLDSENHLYLTDNFTVTHNTISALEGVLAVKTIRPVRNLLVVAPLAVLPHWARTVADLGLADEGVRVCVINYDRLKKLLDVPASALAAKRTATKNRRIAKDGTSLVQWDAVIMDEAHKLRNRDSQRSQAAARIAGYGLPRDQAPFVIWSSATIAHAPVETSFLAPLLAQASRSNAGALNDFGHWLQESGFHVQHDARFDRWLWTDNAAERAEDIVRIREMLFERKTPLALRRLPTDLAGWPEVNRSLLPVALGVAERRLYEQAWSDFRREMRLAQRGGNSKNGMVIRLRFRQKASLLRIQGTVEHTLDLLDNGHQVAISCQFLESVDQIREQLEKHNVAVAVMDGRDPDGREGHRLAFQRGAATVVIVTPVEGYSLHQEELLPDGTVATSAPRSMIIHDVRFSGIEEAQLEGRCHRDGKAAQIYLAFGEDTVEEDVTKVLLGRVESMKAMLGDETDTIQALEAALDGRL